MTTSINYTLDVGFHSDSMYKSYGEITAPEGKKKKTGNFKPAPQVAGSSGILDSKPAALELPRLGFQRRRLPVPVEYSIVNLQRGSFTHFSLYNINKWRSVWGMRPGPVISIVCHVFAQSVCTDRDNNAPNGKMRFPVFFSLRGPCWNF